MSQELLFSKYDWFSVEQHIINTMNDDVQNYDENMFLNTSTDDLFTYFLEKYSPDIPKLLKDEIEADQKGEKINIQNDMHRAIFDRTTPTYINGTRIDILVPFLGDKDIFYIRPSRFNFSPPRAIVHNDKLIFSFSDVELDPIRVKQSFDKIISSVDEYLSNITIDANELNDKIQRTLRVNIETRKEKLLKDRNTVVALGFPLKKRDNATMTYVSSQSKRKIQKNRPIASREAYKPEPVLSFDDYQYILDIINNMALVMEQSPSSFRTLGEEDIRTQFLLHLNGHFEGNASGETFNRSGKTDILIKDKGKNIFIAECKFWSGPKKLLDTIDQLLSYSSWRDTKTAIIIFNKNIDFTSVIKSIKENIKKHKQFKKHVKHLSETSFQYTFSHSDDSNRELTLTILAFNIPLSEMPSA